MIALEENGNIFATLKASLIHQNPIEKKEGKEAFFHVEKVVNTGLILRESSQTYFLSQKVNELQKDFKEGATVMASIRKMYDDKVNPHMKAVLAVKPVYPNLHESLTAAFFAESHIFPKSKTLPLTIGQKLNAKVTLIKEYGIIVKVGQFTGFLLIQNLQHALKTYTLNASLSVQVLDIDPEKEIIDLVEVDPSASSNNAYYYLDILLVKENYLIGFYNHQVAKYILSPNESSKAFSIG